MQRTIVCERLHAHIDTEVVLHLSRVCLYGHGRTYSSRNAGSFSRAAYEKHDCLYGGSYSTGCQSNVKEMVIRSPAATFSLARMVALRATKKTPPFFIISLVFQDVFPTCAVMGYMPHARLRRVSSLVYFLGTAIYTQPPEPENRCVVAVKEKIHFMRRSSVVPEVGLEPTT